MNFDYTTILYSIPAVIIGLTVHEFSHAFAAFKLGDSTASNNGRLTFNPLKHIDPIGILFLLIAGFGWAKPVTFNPENLKNRRRDEIIIAMAGPVSNLILGFLLAGIFRLLTALVPFTGNSFQAVSYNILIYAVFINFGLFIFNIIPLPPLDGSHVLFQGANISAALQAKLMKYGSYVLFIIIIIERRANIDILPIGVCVNWLVKLALK